MSVLVCLLFMCQLQVGNILLWVCESVFRLTESYAGLERVNREAAETESRREGERAESKSVINMETKRGQGTETTVKTERQGY